jgi:hypothetical protein
MRLNKKWMKILLDLAMALVFVLLFDKAAVAGLQFHEIAGLVIGAAFILHNLLNRKWISQITKYLFDNRVRAKAKINYTVDVLLLICMATTIISGIAISKVLFPNHNLSGLHLKALHIASAYLALALVGTHIGLHWNWIMNQIKNAMKAKQNRRVRNYVIRLMAVAIFAFGIYNMIQVHYISQISSVITEDAFGKEQYGMRENRPNNGWNKNGPGSSETSHQQNRFGNKNAERNTDILQIIGQYMSILSVFAGAAFYFEKLLKTQKGKVQ